MTVSFLEDGVGAKPCMHVIGIGRTGAVYVEALLRTGEIEDNLTDPGATFAVLALDIGDDDLSLAEDYGAAFVKRLQTRAIPPERYMFRSVPLAVPTKEALQAGLKQTPAFLGLAEGVEFDPYVPATRELPKTGEHFPRAIAKAIYANAYHSGDKMLDDALSAFVEHVEKSSPPSIIAICFSLAGGTGSGMVVDLARDLSAKLGREIPVVGVGQLPHSGDPDIYRDSPALFATLNDIDCMLDPDKNATVVTRFGEAHRNPFTGGFFVVNPEQSWQRLTAYTSTGEARIRQSIKEMVTNRFVADSFMRWCVADGSGDMLRVVKKAEAKPFGARSWTMFNVAKLTHPGVQVLPGEAPSKWDAVISQWIGFTRKYDGLKANFKTDLAEVAIYGSRNMGHQDMVDMFRNLIQSQYMPDAGSDLIMSVHEFFDTLTAYANIVLSGVAKTDLSAFAASQKVYEKLSAEEKLLEHSWLLEVGPLVSDPTIRFEGIPRQCLGAPVVQVADMRGEASSLKQKQAKEPKSAVL